MRHGRAKAARKTLQFFRLHLGIRPPYHVILDGTFLVSVVKQKVPLRERLSRMLQHHPFVLYVTRSSLKELEALVERVPEEKKETLRQARQWGLDETDVILEPKNVPRGQDEVDSVDVGAAGKDILKFVSNKPRYLVATQDEALLDALRAMGTAPLLRLARAVLLLENPSKASRLKASSREHQKWFSGSVKEPEQALVQHVHEERKKQRQEERKQSTIPQKRVTHKAKGPNPLSCKPKKRPVEEPVDKPKRKRRRKHSSGEASSST